MANGISDKSRRYTLLALDELEKIVQKHPLLPHIDSLQEEQVSWLNERIRSFHESVKKTNFKRFSFFGQSKEVRNLLAHATGDVSKEDISAAWQTFFDFAPKAKAELEQNLKRFYSENKDIRQFEKFGSAQFGGESERKRLVQSLADGLDASLADAERLAFAHTQAAEEVQKFLVPENQAQKDLLGFAKNHTIVNQQGLAEILTTLQSAYKETEITDHENPFYEENMFVSSLQHLSGEDLLAQLSDLQKKLLATSSGKNNTAPLQFYAEQYADLLKPEKAKDAKQEKPDQQQVDALARNLKADLQKSLLERYTAWQLIEIDKRRKAYREELYKKIAQFKKLEELLSPFITSFGRLWDLSLGNFDDYGFDILKLKEFAALLESDVSLQELAELLGRQNAETERYEKELREKVEIKTEFHPKPAYRGQLSGIRLSGEISSALARELAMSKNPSAKLYFAQKFAEHKLLSYAYVNQQKSYREERKTEEVEVLVKEMEQKGPVILCIDTSGSMNGSPERVAKTITLALAKKCLEEDRKCYLISFSTEIEVQDLTEFKKSNGLVELVKFLRKSFNGGTDAQPALGYAIELLQKNEWKNADVLIVSDMVMGDFSEDAASRIKAQQEKKTKFYSLLVGESGNKNVTAVFDENWSYDLSARDSMRHLVRELKHI